MNLSDYSLEIQALHIISNRVSGVGIWKWPRGWGEKGYGLNDLELSLPIMDQIKLIWQLTEEGYLQKERRLAPSNWDHQTFTGYKIAPRGRKLLKEMGL